MKFALLLFVTFVALYFEPSLQNRLADNSTLQKYKNERTGPLDLRKLLKMADSNEDMRHELHRHMDLDADGILSANDIKNFLRNHLVFSSKDEENKFLNILRNATLFNINEEEMKIKLENREKFHPSTASTDPPYATEAPNQIDKFAALKQNDKFSAMHKKVRLSKKNRTIADELFTQIDVNQDGKIDIGEIAQFEREHLNETIDEFDSQYLLFRYRYRKGYEFVRPAHLTRFEFHEAHNYEKSDVPISQPFFYKNFEADFDRNQNHDILEIFALPKNFSSKSPFFYSKSFEVPSRVDHILVVYNHAFKGMKKKEMLAKSKHNMTIANALFDAMDFNLDNALDASELTHFLNRYFYKQHDENDVYIDLERYRNENNFHDYNSAKISRREFHWGHDYDDRSTTHPKWLYNNIMRYFFLD